MGSQVLAICICGVNKTILIGGGKLNFQKINYFPAYCPSCLELVQVNLWDKKLTCPECHINDVIPYNNSILIGEKGSKTVTRSFGYELTNGTYFCSSCECMNLRFELGRLLWD